MTARQATMFSLFLLVLSAGCKDAGEGIVSLPGGHKLVTGSVVSVEDAVPVDGGVTLTLEISDGSTVTVYLESFFTVTPPPPERWQVYEIVRDVKTGDRVRVVVEEREGKWWMRKAEKL